jgi:hypothetical protein
LNTDHPDNFYRRTVFFPPVVMTEHVKLILIAQVALAILVLPSSASGVCNCSGEDFDWGDFSSVPDAQACYEYCKSPVAYDSNVTMYENTLVEITLHATDPDGDTMTYSISSGPSDGTLVIFTGDTVVYAPHENYTGIDSFSFRAHDGNWDSNIATVTITIEPDSSPQYSHAFYGNVTIDGEPVPESTTILVVGPGVRSDTAGNPVATQTDGSYGSAGITAQNLVVQGCIGNGTPLAFYADGVRAEVTDVNTSGPWQSACPFRAGEVTNLDIRVPSIVPPPDEVYIDALTLSMTISNSTYEFSTDIKLKGDPWMEARVTRGMFTIRISAIGVHRFSDQPELRQDATLGIYENGNPVSSEKNVWFGSKEVRYEYFATETRTFDILISVNERPEIHDVKHITIYAGSASDRHTIIATADPGGSISPGGQVSVDEGANQRFDITPSDGYQIADVIVDGRPKGAISRYTFSHVRSDHQIHATFTEVPYD